MQREPVQRRRPVADQRVGDAVQPLLHAPARLVRLAIGEPAQLRADHELHLRARAPRQRRRLEPALAAAHHHDRAVAVRLVVLAVDRERDALAEEGVERRRGVGEGRHADGHDDVARVRLPARCRRHAKQPAAAFETRDVGLVVLGHERLAEPVGVAEELRERDRLLARLAGRARPGVDRATVPGRRQVGLVPVGAQPHVRRHARPPRLHRPAEGTDAAVGEVGRDREAERPGSDNRDIQSIGHDRQRTARVRSAALALLEPDGHGELAADQERLADAARASGTPRAS